MTHIFSKNFKYLKRKNAICIEYFNILSIPD